MAKRNRMDDMFATISRDIRLKMQGAPARVSDIIEEVAEQQADDMRSIIFTSFRPSSSSNPDGGRGRYQTGRMVDSVTAKVNIGSTRTTAKVGYIKGTPRDYFYYQDRGFDHLSAGWVEGTHALGLSYVKARESFIKAMNEIGLKGGI